MPSLSLARRCRVVHADTGGFSRVSASSSSVAATVAPSVRIVPPRQPRGHRSRGPRRSRARRTGTRWSESDPRLPRRLAYPGRVPATAPRVPPTFRRPRATHTSTTTHALHDSRFLEFWLRPGNSAALPGSCHKPPVRYMLRVERSKYSPFPFSWPDRSDRVDGTPTMVDVAQGRERCVEATLRERRAHSPSLVTALSSRGFAVRM